MAPLQRGVQRALALGCDAIAARGSEPEAVVQRRGQRAHTERRRTCSSHGGSFPLHVAGVGCVGAVTVSGLPQRDDHALVVEALAATCGVPIDEFQLDVGSAGSR